MPDNDAKNVPESPEAELVYRNYPETCRRAGVEPVSREHAEDLMAEWSDAIAAGRSASPNTH